LQLAGWHTKFLAVGSSGGLDAARRGECDLAGIHLLDEQADTYNTPFLSAGLELFAGYRRMQGIVYRRGDERFEEREPDEAVRMALADPACILINRNRGSGTRVLIDRLLAGARPSGYAHQARNHNAIAAAITQGRADWGVAIEHVARQADLGFIPVKQEQYDFVGPATRADRPAVQALRDFLRDPDIRQALAQRGCLVESS
jgi:putative molybdopterin biosynthesis protein